MFSLYRRQRDSVNRFNFTPSTPIPGKLIEMVEKKEKGIWKYVLPTKQMKTFMAG